MKSGVDLSSFDELEQAQILAYELRDQAKTRAHLAAIVFSACPDSDRAKNIYEAMLRVSGHDVSQENEEMDSYIKVMDKQYNILTEGGTTRLDIKDNE